MSEDNFLSRWSRRKIEARKGEGESAPGARPGDDASQLVPPTQSIPAQAIAPGPDNGARAPAPLRGRPAEELPALESLTPHSDFSPFMREGVDPALKGHALRTLFSDPALYPMDGLDVYIDDYSQPDPLPEGWLEKLNQFATLDSHNQPERDAEASKVPAIPASTPPTESAQALPISQAEPSPAGPPSDTSATPPDAPDAVRNA
jgi:hypothetical protein